MIDGVLNDDATFLNPQDIATIEVLKDAASSAIYGVRGANGVIIITTKGGQDGKARLNVNYYHLFGKLAHKLQTASAKDLTYFRKIDGGGAGAGAAVNPDSVSTYDNQDNDYQDLLYRTGNKDNINVSVSGGAKGLLYYASANYISDRSIIINSHAQTLATIFNVDYQATDKFKIINHIGLSYITGNSVDVGNTANQVFQRNPWVSLYRPDGSLAGYVESKRNPVAFALLGENVPTTYTIQDNIVANYQIYKDLRFATSFDARLDDATAKPLYRYPSLRERQAPIVVPAVLIINCIMKFRLILTITNRSIKTITLPLHWVTAVIIIVMMVIRFRCRISKAKRSAYQAMPIFHHWQLLLPQLTALPNQCLAACNTVTKTAILLTEQRAGMVHQGLGRITSGVILAQLV